MSVNKYKASKLTEKDSTAAENTVGGEFQQFFVNQKKNMNLHKNDFKKTFNTKILAMRSGTKKNSLQ